ncbi:MAG: ORF6N domain-containing protein [Candidatus Omnitrophota bacterium]
MNTNSLISAETIAAKIIIVRGKRVMLDRDLAQLYGVETRALNQAVKRNISRFPEDFMLSLTREEILRISQFVISLKFSKTTYAFTEQGVAMLSSVLNSERAIMVNIQIMRAFIQLKRLLLTNVDLRRKIEEMENKYDKQFALVFQAIKQLLEPLPVKPKPRIGFR